MKKRLAALLVVALGSGFVLFLPSPASAQITAEINLGLGISIVSLEKWYGGTVIDWNKMMFGGEAQVYFAKLGKLNVGAEGGYTYHFWYTVPSGYSWVYTYEPTSFNFGAVARMDLPKNFFVDFGVGLHFFSGDFTRVAVMGEGGYMFKLNEKMSIPVKIRTTIIVGDPILIPIRASVGFLMHF